MANEYEELVWRRYEILQPYISKEKTLKNLSEESRISYSTIKRWASSYKKNGLEGLKKSGRSDKSTYRTLNEDTMNYIKELYSENPNLKILDYYNKIVDFLKRTNTKSVSYDTIYRVINQLDPYMKDYALDIQRKERGPNEVFELEYFQLDYLVWDERDSSLKRPYLNIINDSFSDVILGFSLSFDKITLYESLALLRKTIITLKNTKDYRKPKEFVLKNLKFQEKNILENIKKELGIDVKFSMGSENKLKDFFDVYNSLYLKEMIYKMDYSINYGTLQEISKSYIEKNFGKFRETSNLNFMKKSKKIGIDDPLDTLLTPYKSKRKVKDGAIRFQNLLYEDPVLEAYEDIELEVKFDPFDLSVIKVYDYNFYICDLHCKMLGKYPLSYYDFLCIRKIIKMNFSESGITLKQYGKEFQKLVERRCTK